MLTYAIGMMLNGRLCDRYPAPQLAGLGLLGASLGFLGLYVFGLSGLFSPLAFAAIWLLEGYFQSFVYPACLKIMGSTFRTSSLGKVMGLWASNTSIGNILGAALVTLLVGVYSFD